MDDHRPPPLRPSRSRRRSRSRNGRGGGSTGELFVCFPLRWPSWSWGWSSSSMRTPSARSLPSPGRTKDASGGGPSSITGSLSRRLRSSGSVKGGQSPAIFPSLIGGGKKKATGGAGYEGAAPAAAEPSSPKVTCIGQVRVKTGRRKHKKKTAAAAEAAAGGGIDASMALRSRSRREGGGSFRRADSGDHFAAASARGSSGSCSCCIPRRDQSWVYLPLGAMCEALRALACCFRGWRCSRCWGCRCTEEKGKGNEKAGSKRMMSWSWCCFRCSASSTCCSGCCTCDGGGCCGHKKKGARRRGKQQKQHQKRSTAQAGTVCSCTAAFARCWMMEMHVEKGGRRGRQEEEKEHADDEELSGAAAAMVMERGRSRRGMAELQLVADELERGMWKTVESATALIDGEVEIAADDDVNIPPAPPPPPPNALLLMRCRSDPVKMAALATRFVDFPATKLEIRDVEEERQEEDTRNRSGIRIPVQPSNPKAEIIKEERKTAAEVAATGKATAAGVGGGRDQQQGPSSSRPVLEIEEASGKRGGGDRILEKRDTKQPPHHSASRPSDVPLTNAPATATAGIEIHPSKKLPPLPVEIENRAATQLSEHPQPKLGIEEKSTRKEERRPDLVIPRVRDVRNNAPPLKERRSFSKDKDAALPAAPVGGRRPSFSSSDREDSTVGARRSSSFREGRRSSFSSDGGDARRSSFGADAKGEGKRRWSFSSEKDAKRPEDVVGDPAPPRGRTRRDQAAGGGASAAKCGGALPPGTVATEEPKGAELPDCLLLMMYEPKLSMEVSKETWVCTADFVRWRPHQQQQRQHHEHQHQHQHQVNGAALGPGEASKATAAEHPVTEEAAEGAVAGEEAGHTAAESPLPEEEHVTTASASPSPPPPLSPSQRPQLSLSAKWKEAAAATNQKPGSASAAAAAVGNAAASSCGPSTLTRCNSDPIRLSSSPGGMSPEGCFWKSRYLPTAAAGIGF